MSFKYIKEVMSPEELKDMIPMSEEGKKIKAIRDAEIKNIFEGHDNRFIMIVGPCSADNEDSVLEYLTKLRAVSEKVQDKIYIIPRIYTNKPRTTGIGYKGIVHQPDPTKAPDLREGLIAMRHMHIRAINETGFTSADEMLYPENFMYVDDMLSYVAVGARSVENQQHRLTASGMDVPAGMKNPTSGTLSVMINSIIAAQSPQTFMYRQEEVATSGNKLAHAILRGSTNKHDQYIPNYHYEDLELTIELYKQHPNLVNPAIIVDANHANSAKKYYEQPRIVKEIIHSCKVNPEIGKVVKGVMVESYLVAGAQKIDTANHVYGQSITDPCLGFLETEKLIMEMADALA